ncbi:1965_t:CDS:2 [Entrophospora sp. SA101]|nr:1965_t:CDS:2 [Entrophospora sp. SA101]
MYNVVNTATAAKADHLPTHGSLIRNSPMIIYDHMTFDDWSYISHLIDPDLSEGDSLHIWVAHDETVFESNDGKKEGWHPVNEQPLMKKSHG